MFFDLRSSSTGERQDLKICPGEVLRFREPLTPYAIAQGFPKFRPSLEGFLSSLRMLLRIVTIYVSMGSCISHLI